MLIKNLDQPTFTLDNFEGPLDLLFHLIQKNEIDIYNISINRITEQYKELIDDLQKLCVESGAEFIGLAASLLWIKSKMLLPRDEQGSPEEAEQLESEFAIIHQLIDYCRFKDAAQELSSRESKQQGFYLRGSDPDQQAPKKPIGIEHLSIQDFASVFQQLIEKATSAKKLIEEDKWQVSDKVSLLRALLIKTEMLPIATLFSEGSCKEELIVLFLAILELMKLGEIKVAKETSTQSIVILSTYGKRN